MQGTRTDNGSAASGNQAIGQNEIADLNSVSLLNPNNGEADQEVAQVKGVYVATKAKSTSYRRPHKSTTSQPLYEKVLTATNVQVNSGISDSAFVLDFPVGTRVWDSTLQIVYQVPEPESPGQ